MHYTIFKNEFLCKVLSSIRLSSQLILVIVLLLLLSAGRSAALALVQLGNDGLHNVLHLLLLGLQILSRSVLRERNFRMTVRIDQVIKNLPCCPPAT